MSNKANFMPVQFAGAFEMWSPDRLIIETVTKRLGNDSWLQVTSSRDKRYEETSAIVEDTQEKLIEACQLGVLTAYVHNVETGLFYVIPEPVWDGFDAIGYLAGRLYLGVMDDDYHRSIPNAFLNTSIMVLGDDAKAWLKGSTVASLPATLKSPVPGGALDRWFGKLSAEQLALENEDFVKSARDFFPGHRVARDRVLDMKRRSVGLGSPGRPKINGE